MNDSFPGYVSQHKSLVSVRKMQLLVIITSRGLKVSSTFFFFLYYTLDLNADPRYCSSGSSARSLVESWTNSQCASRRFLGWQDLQSNIPGSAS